MKNVKDYLKLADECRKLARNSTLEAHRSKTWEEMAAQRQERIDRRQAKEHKKPKGGGRAPSK